MTEQLTLTPPSENRPAKLTRAGVQLTETNILSFNMSHMEDAIPASLIFQRMHIGASLMELSYFEKKIS